MSLLLDALKRAEEAKRAAREAAARSGQPYNDSPSAAPSPPPPSNSPRGDATDSSGLSAAVSPSATPPSPLSSAPALSLGGASAPVAAFPALSLEEIDTDPSVPPPAPAETGRPLEVSADAAVGGLSLEMLDSIPVATGELPPDLPPHAHDAAEELAALSLGRTKTGTAGGSRTGTGSSGSAPAHADPAPASRAIAAPATRANAASPNLGPSSPEGGAPNAELATDAQKEKARESARNVFAAKDVAGRATPRPWLAPAIGIGVVVVGAGGWYVWSEVSRVKKATPPIARNAPTPAAPSAPVPLSTAPAPAPSNVGPTAPSAPATNPASSPPTEPALPPLIPPEVVVRESIAKPTKRGKAPPPTPVDPRELLLTELQKTAPIKDSGVQLKISREVAPQSIPAALSKAYETLASGDYPAAKRLYAQLIADSPNDVDAHLGFATAAAMSGEKPLAATHYRRVLDLDPRNSTAASGLLSVTESVSVGTMESELRGLIAKDGNAPALQFALGNLYAGNQRWQDAQAAYFEAFRLEPNNPDYAVNLAISLDRLSQTKLALNYYQRALSINRRGNFNRSSIEKRVAELGAR